MAYNPNNIFAKILRGELPKVALYEDDLTLALMDIMPSTEGHTLVITKKSRPRAFSICRRMGPRR